MKISVIVPLYYGKKYIQNIVNMMRRNQEKCIDVADLELILVNDSPDEKISEDEWKGQKDFDIKLVSNQKNQGIHYSRVYGLSYATGQYIMFFDQDDIIADDYFVSQLKHMSKKCDVVVANGSAQYATYSKCLYRFAFMQWTVKHIWFYAKFDCRIISPGQCLIRKDSIPEIWKKNILKINGADDYFLWLLLLTRKCKFDINREKIYIHVYTTVNTSNDENKMKQSVIEMLSLVGKSISIKNQKRIGARISRRNGIIDSITKIVENMNRRNL